MRIRVQNKNDTFLRSLPTVKYKKSCVPSKSLLFISHSSIWLIFSNWCIFSDSIILVVKFPKKIFRLHELPHSSSELAYHAPGFGAAFRDHEWFCREFNTELPHFYTLLYPFITSPLSMCNFETWALYRCIQKKQQKKNDLKTAWL